LKAKKTDDLRSGRHTRIADSAVFNNPRRLEQAAADDAGSLATASQASPTDNVKPAAYAEVSAPTVVNQAYAELPVDPEAKQPGPPPQPDQKARAIPAPSGSPGAAGQ
jgi:hypothetical protein